MGKSRISKVEFGMPNSECEMCKKKRMIGLFRWYRNFVFGPPAAPAIFAGSAVQVAATVFVGQSSVENDTDTRTIHAHYISF